MTSLSRNILDFYKQTDANLWYLNKYFTSTSALGHHEPNSERVFQRKWDGKEPHVGTIDEHNTYYINELGFRGEVYKDCDLIALGCSITFGIGIPEYGRWTNILGNKLNKDVMNMGNPGASVETITNNIFNYCSNNKMPKEIFCLFPDFFRSMVVADQDFYKTKGNKWAEKKENLQYVFCNPAILFNGIDSLFMEITDKKYIEDSVSPHQNILNAVNSIHNLELFCSSNNIKLHWTTWDLPSTLVMESLSKLKDFKLKNFTSFYPPEPNEYLGNFVEKTCNSKHDSEFAKDFCWKVGSDYSIVDSKRAKNTSHPGIHAQTHIADLFYDLYNKEES